MLAGQNLKAEKMMSSLDAPVEWQNGNYNDVAEYCLKDAQLTYDLYKHMQDYSFVKSRSLETGEIVEIEIEW